MRTDDDHAAKEFNKVEWSVGHHTPSVSYKLTIIFV